MLILQGMFDQDSVQFRHGEPLIANSKELIRVEHFDSEFEGLMRRLTVPQKAKQQVEKQLKAKMNSQWDGCLQVLSYHFQKAQKGWELQMCLAPSVQQVLFEKLRKQIVGEYYISSAQLREYTAELVETAASLQQANEYRDINLWNVFEGLQSQLLVGELTQCESKRPVSALYGAMVDYMSPQRRGQQPLNKGLEMSWGIGMVLLALAVNQLPRCLNLKQMEAKLNRWLKLAQERFGWDLYEVLRQLIFQSQDRATCSQLRKSQAYEKWVFGGEGQLLTVRFRSLSNYQVAKHCRELTIYQCEDVQGIQLHGRLNSLTVKFSKMAEPTKLWNRNCQSLEIVQCEVPLLKLIKLQGLASVVNLALVGLHLRQSHLKLLLNMKSHVRMLDLSMNRELGDHGLLMLLQSQWIHILQELKMGGPDSGCGLTNHSLTLLIEHSTRITQLSLLDLSWNKFNQDGYRLLVHSFEKLSSIYQIDLTRTAIDDPDPKLPNVIV